MWWRRWVSPVVGSTAMPGTFRALCERCMPRLEGDFLFCWTAIIRSWYSSHAATAWLGLFNRLVNLRRLGLRQALDYSPSNQITASQPNSAFGGLAQSCQGGKWIGFGRLGHLKVDMLGLQLDIARA